MDEQTSYKLYNFKAAIYYLQSPQCQLVAKVTSGIKSLLLSSVSEDDFLTLALDFWSWTEKLLLQKSINPLDLVFLLHLLTSLLF